jgi:predicted DNA-binding protein with PD1-like motif
MEYQAGCIGRIFVARIDHGEDLLAELEGLAKLEDIRQAFFILERSRTCVS